MPKLDLKNNFDTAVIRRIFSHKKPYFDKSSLICVNPMPKDLDEDIKSAEILLKNREIYSNNSMEIANPAFCYNINYFGQLEGFKIIFNIFETSEPKCSEIRNAKRLIKAIFNISEYMDKDHWANFIIPIAKSATNYLSKFNENELRILKPADLTKFTMHLHKLFRSTPEISKTIGINPAEEVELQIGLKFCYLPSLERKLSGVGMLISKLNRLSQKWPKKAKEPSINNEAFLFAEWLRANKLKELLFGETIREEVLKRAGELLVFMYAWGMLNGQEIVDLWDYAISRGDSLQPTIIQLIETISIHLSKKDACLLFNKLKQLPLNMLRENMIGILNALAKNEYYRNKKKERIEQKVENVKETLKEEKKEIIKENKILPEENKLLGGNTLDGIVKPKKRALDADDITRSDQEAMQTLTSSDLRELARNNFAIPDRKRTKDDSEQISRKQHTRTGSGDHTTIPYRARPDLELEPYIPDEEPESPIIEPCDILNYIWSLSNEGAIREGLQLVVQTQLIELFLTLLSRFYKEKCQTYLNMAEGMIAGDNSFYQCSKIYIKIAELLGRDTHWKLQTTTEDLMQKIIIGLIRFKRISTQKGLEMMTSERTEEEECMDTQSSIEEKNAREGDQFLLNQPNGLLEDTKENIIEQKKIEEKPMVLENSEKEPEKVSSESSNEKPEDLKGNPDLMEETKAVPPETQPQPNEDRDVYLTLITNEYLKLTYYQELEQRLELLKFLVSKGKQALKPESIPLIWQTLLINSFSKKEIDTFFEFMFNIIRSENGLTLVASHVFDAFFFEILLKLDQRSYPLPAFNCLKEMIIALNIIYKHIAVTGLGGYEIIDIRLIGFEAVWEISLQAHEKNVQKAATDFLHDVYKRLSSDLLQKQGQNIREEFLMKCMANVKSGSEVFDREKENTDNIARICRSLELLNSYIKEFEMQPALGAKKSIPSYEFTVLLNKNGNNRERLQVNSSMTLREMLEKIRQKLEYKQEVDKLIFITQGRVLTSSDASLFESGIHEDMTIMVSLPYQDENMQAGVGTFSQPEFDEKANEEGIQTLQAIFEERKFSREIIVSALRKAKGDVNQACEFLSNEVNLAEFQEESKLIENAKLIQTVNQASGKLSEMLANNEKYFPVLYQLLNPINMEITEKVWEVLQNIPINNKFRSELLSIKSMEIQIEWDKIYLVDSPYKFLYSLRIIENILQTETEDSKYEWLTGFIMLGGVLELCNSINLFNDSIKKITGIVSKEYMKIFVKCLENTLKIISTLIEGSLIGLNNQYYLIYKKISQPKQNTTNSQQNTSSSSAPPAKVTTGTDTQIDSHYIPGEQCKSKAEPPKIIAKNGVANNAGELSKNEQNNGKLIIKDEIAQMMLGIIEHQGFIGQFISLMNGISKIDENIINSENTIIEGNNLILLSLLIDLKSGLKLLYCDEKYKEYLYALFFKLKNTDLKLKFTNILMHITEIYKEISVIDLSFQEIVHPDIIHFDYLFSFMPPAENNEPNADAYFAYLYYLLPTLSHPSESDKMKTKIEDCVSVLLRNLKTKLLAEITEIQDDKQLAGYLMILTKIIKMRKDAYELFKKMCDFDIVNSISCEIFGPVSTIEPPTKLKPRKCVIMSTMQAAIKFLQLLCEKSESAALQVLPYIIKFHESQLKCTLKDIGSDIGKKAPGSYVGLKNFGCTCYINSLLQQLFMMPELRYKLLALEPEKIKSLGTDHISANLQKIFATLQMSKEQYYPPADFCKEFTESDGKPINVYKQQDVDEFFNKLAEKLESELKLIGQGNLLTDTMGAILLQEITSLEPDLNYTSPKEDPCVAIPLDIKGRKSIEEALDFFIKEEILEGDNKYYCEEYGRKVRASKKTVLKKIPRTLILNLKRFEFDYTTMQKKKVNDYCEFPMDLNLYKWTYDAAKGLDTQKDYNYQLAGVLVHSGTAEGGHYYSYIKEREPKSQNYGKWFEFNDTRVQPFNPENLKDEAYGNMRKSGYFGDANAYLLIYEKTDNVQNIQNIKQNSDKFAALIEQESEALINARIYLNNGYSEFTRNYLKIFPPETVPSFTALDSDTYEIRKNREMTQNTLEIQKTQNSSENIDPDEQISGGNKGLTIAKLMVLYGNDLIMKSKDTSLFKNWHPLLMPHIKKNSLFALWFIKYMTKHKSSLFDMLIECGSSEIRILFKETIEEALKVVSKIEEPYMRCIEKFLQPSDNPATKREKSLPRAASIRFINMLLSDGLSYCRANCRKFDEFFNILTTFADLGLTECGSLINNGAIYSLIDFVSNSVTPLDPRISQGTTRPAMGESFKEPNFKQPVILLGILIRSCSTARMRLLQSFDKYANFKSIEEAIEMPENEIEFLFSAKWNYLSLAVNNKQDLISILIHVSWEDERRIKEIIQGLTKYVFEKRMTPNHAMSIEVLKELIMVKDSYLKLRCFTFLYTEVFTRKSVFEYLEYYRENQDTFVIDILEMLAELASYDKIAEMLIEDKAKLLWAPDWLDVQLNKKSIFNAANPIFPEAKNAAAFTVSENKNAADSQLYDEQKRKIKFILRYFGELLDLKITPKTQPVAMTMTMAMDANEIISSNNPSGAEINNESMKIQENKNEEIKKQN